MEGCDTLLIAGTSFPYIEFYPKPGQAKCSADRHRPERIGLRYPGGCRPGRRLPARVFSALLPMLRAKRGSQLPGDMPRPA